MNIFKPIILLWWQVVLVKVSLISLGIIIGAYWPSFFKKSLLLWVILFIIPAIYLATVRLGQ